MRAPPRDRWDQPGFAEVRGRKLRLPKVPASLHALECRLQRLHQDAGETTDAIGTPLPGTTPSGLDGFLAQFDGAGNRNWTVQVGTTADDQLWGVAADAAGNATVTGYTGGSLFAANTHPPGRGRASLPLPAPVGLAVKRHPQDHERFCPNHGRKSIDNTHAPRRDGSQHGAVVSTDDERELERCASRASNERSQWAAADVHGRSRTELERSSRPHRVIRKQALSEGPLR